MKIDTFENKRISENIKAARKRADLTQKEVAIKMDISQQAYARWENGQRKPKLETLQKIADACGCEVFELLKHQEDK